jgi:hypothetical protein
MAGRGRLCLGLFSLVHPTAVVAFPCQMEDQMLGVVPWTCPVERYDLVGIGGAINMSEPSDTSRANSGPGAVPKIPNEMVLGP